MIEYVYLKGGVTERDVLPQKSYFGLKIWVTRKIVFGFLWSWMPQ